MYRTTCKRFYQIYFSQYLVNTMLSLVLYSSKQKTKQKKKPSPNGTSTEVQKNKFENVSSCIHNHGSPKRMRRCVEAFWECPLHDHSLHHMGNQSNGIARRHARVTSSTRNLKSMCSGAASASWSKANAARDAGSMSLRRSASIPFGDPWLHM